MQKRVLVLGKGGREHALAWALSRSDQVAQVFVAPGSEAMRGEKVTPLFISEDKTETLLAFAKNEGIYLVVIGPEGPIAAGAGDRFSDAGFLCLAPSKHAARIESSKAFAKKFMQRFDIACSKSETFDDFTKAEAFIENAPWPFVLKASGLAAGKGVVLSKDISEAKAALKDMMLGARFGEAGKVVVVEEKLEGQEISVMALCDGERARLLPFCKDHKRLLDADRGPNTGGMGATAPVRVSENERAFIENNIIKRALYGMQKSFTPYKGVLFAGVMLTQEGPKVLEFNCRFGDPETQALLPLLESDLFSLLCACAKQELHNQEIVFSKDASAALVMASKEYPHSGSSPQKINGLENVKGAQVFHAATTYEKDGCYSAGGRVLSVSAQASTLAEASEKAYENIAKISFEGAHFRKDIGR